MHNHRKVEQIMRLLEQKARNLKFEFIPSKKYVNRNRHRDTGIKNLGILILALTLVAFYLVSSLFSQIFRAFTPWVPGTGVGTLYWQSMAFGLKAGFIFLLCICGILIFLFNFKNRK